MARTPKKACSPLVWLESYFSLYHQDAGRKQISAQMVPLGTFNGERQHVGISKQTRDDQAPGMGWKWKCGRAPCTCSAVGLEQYKVQPPLPDVVPRQVGRDGERSPTTQQQGPQSARVQKGQGHKIPMCWERKKKAEPLTQWPSPLFVTTCGSLGISLLLFSFYPLMILPIVIYTSTFQSNTYTSFWFTLQALW